MIAGNVFRANSIKQSIISQKTKLKIIEREKLRKDKHLSTTKNQEFKAIRKEVNKMIQFDVRKHETGLMENTIESGLS